MEAQSRDYALLLFRMTARVIYSARYHRQHCTPHAFKQFEAQSVSVYPTQTQMHLLGRKYKKTYNFLAVHKHNFF